MNNEMDCPPLDFIARYSMLKQKLAAAATDALRLLMLESEGYKTDATELIDPEDTPKNIMLRGFRRKSFDPCSDKMCIRDRNKAGIQRRGTHPRQEKHRKPRGTVPGIREKSDKKARNSDKRKTKRRH